MRPFARFTTCSALALGVAAGPAAADLTAQEVWDGMQSAMQNYGYTVDATQTPNSGGLDVSDVSMRIDFPENEGTVSFVIPELELEENSDGSVSMTFPAAMPITIDATPKDDDAVNMVLDYANSGLELIVSGDPSKMTYTYDAEQMSITLAELTINGDVIGRDKARFEFVMEGLSGVTTIASGSTTEISQDMRADTARYDLAFNDPESDDVALVTGSLAALYIESSTELPEGFDPSDAQSLAAGGFSGGGKMGYEDGNMQFAVTDDEGTTTGTTRSGTVALAFEMNSELMRYDVAATDQEVGLTGPEMPVPVNFSMAESAFSFTAPIAASETPQDMAFGLTLGGFEMADVLWNMVDPSATLPRDPATIALDVTGQVTPFVNLFDPAEMEKIEDTGAAPGELNTLTLNNLTVEVAGARLGGTGSFTFDNDDTETFDGFPRPTGAVNLTLDGANGLIDKLIAMGVLTQEDAMGARMMMSMFAVPGDSPDSLKSSIQINEQGHVLANGMRIQ
ncbi:DUF2125 domain-containing protein [Marivita sp. S2033]|uniref:DUF2125 domain-containing protein n=1 Tax=Marivita sp. S2033 TaxID=3373187 RepID=UPI003982A041